MLNANQLMNAIDLLEKQHEETLKLLSTLEDSSPGRERKNTFSEMQHSLLAHMVIEEEVFYPNVASQIDEGEPVAEGYEEHVGARGALDRCAKALAEDELFGIRIKVLTEMLKHHIKEERTQIFPRAKKALPSEELEALGEEMEARFEKAKKASGAASKLDRSATTRAKQALHPESSRVLRAPLAAREVVPWALRRSATEPARV